MGSASRPRWALVITSAASFMVALDTLVVSTALPRIRTDLGASLGQLEWTVNAYTLSFAGFLMAAAAIGDRLGRRRMFAFGLGLFTAASAACALAPSIGWLIAARTVQGLGGAFVMPLAMALLSEAFPAEQRAKALGLFNALTGLAVLSGPVIGGAVTQGLAWQWIFWLNVPIGLLAIPAVFARLSESFGAKISFDRVGAALATGAGLALVWGLVRANSVGWSSAEVIGTLAGGSLLTMAFAAWERRAPHPMLPLRLFRSRAFAAGNASGFFLNAALIGVLFFITQFLQTGQGDGPLSAGLRLLPWTVTLFFVAPLAGALMDRIGERPLIVGGLLLQTIGFAWIAWIAKSDLAYWHLIPPLVVAGAGVSMAMPSSQNAVIGAVAPHEIGIASGAYNMFRLLGSSFGVAILAAVFAGRGSYASPHAFSGGFTAAIAAGAGLSFLAAAAGVAIPRRRGPEVVSAAAAPAPQLASQIDRHGAAS
jgi:EmrB/QacA subfamily drug resistance transporter